ncbi:WD40-repeat-containing domain protein [Gorgonomyces haynaldii]|nr:WD40-repeat-containing domain protein [Gorgonomyces haynaldii]
MASVPALPPKRNSIKRDSTSNKTSTTKLDDDDQTQKQFQLEPFTANIDIDTDEELDVEQVPLETFEDDDESEIDESLEQAVRNINEKSSIFAVDSEDKTERPAPLLTKHPEVIDDFIRNYLSSKGLFKSLEAFQNEWYEAQQKGKLTPEDLTIVPDVYKQNQQFADAIAKLRQDVDSYKEIAGKARATYDKLRKERDFHRMHHNRVVQEKHKLIADIKKLKKHYESYEPTLKQLQHKYEIAMKEKMLTKLERDRIASKITSMETVPQERKPEPVKQKQEKKKEVKEIEDRPNPYLAVELPSLKLEQLKQGNHFRAHSLGIASIKFHPKKSVIATVSDDRSWKMWSFPTGDLIMSGEGHKDWIADCDFHPRGNQLATASGDCTVKLWDFAKGIATLTLSDHTRAVWSCSFHDQGDHLVTGSMDQTCKLWDITTGKCRQTFRAHADSVNFAAFQPFTSTVYTCSGDKTISFWDTRSGQCSQTLFGHLNAVNHALFSLKGHVFASCDASGTVKTWDVRNIQETGSYQLGPEAANKLSLDPSGNHIAVAGNDGCIKLISLHDGRVREMKIDDSIQTVAIDKSAEYLVAGTSDGTVKVLSDK